MITHPEYPNLLFFRSLQHFDKKIQHFSTTRNGGVSSGSFESLNLGNYSDDSSLNIFENRTRVARNFHLEAEKLMTPHQTHGNQVLLVDQAFLNLTNRSKIEKSYGYDASITCERGFFLCVTTADCVPILLYDQEKKAVAAIHAGWRSTAGRIVENTINAMKTHFGTSPENIVAAIGPAIGIEHYEVGSEVITALQKNGIEMNDADAVFYHNSSNGKAHIDLKEINKQTLIKMGVPTDQIEKTSYCTYSNENMFFSARRQSIHSGRMLTGIMLR